MRRVEVKPSRVAQIVIEEVKLLAEVVGLAWECVPGEVELGVAGYGEGEAGGTAPGNGEGEGRREGAEKEGSGGVEKRGAEKLRRLRGLEEEGRWAFGRYRVASLGRVSMGYEWKEVRIKKGN